MEFINLWELLPALLMLCFWSIEGPCRGDADGQQKGKRCFLTEHHKSSKNDSASIQSGKTFSTAITLYCFVAHLCSEETSFKNYFVTI